MNDFRGDGGEREIERESVGAREGRGGKRRHRRWIQNIVSPGRLLCNNNDM